MTKTSTGTGRWTKRILVASLALNLLVVGALVGAFVSGGPKGGAARFDLTVGPITRAMTPERRDAVRLALRDSGAFRPADRREIRADMEVLVATLRAETFDAVAFQDALARQRDRLQAGQETVIAAVAAQIAEMPLAERAAYADRLEQHLRRGPGSRSERSN